MNAHDDKYGTPTTRRHPRTFGDAFRNTVEYADPIERYSKCPNWVALLLGAIDVVLVVGVLLTIYFTVALLFSI